jgi:hypothetical protein
MLAGIKNLVAVTRQKIGKPVLQGGDGEVINRIAAGDAGCLNCLPQLLAGVADQDQLAGCRAQCAADWLRQ